MEVTVAVDTVVDQLGGGAVRGTSHSLESSGDDVVTDIAARALSKTNEVGTKTSDMRSSHGSTGHLLSATAGDGGEDANTRSENVNCFVNHGMLARKRGNKSCLATYR